MEFPMPNTVLDGRIVVASVYTNLNIGDGDNAALVLTLGDASPYFQVAEYSLVTGKQLWNEDHHNIVPAVEAYQNNGGDY